MPTYDFRCDVCERETSVFLSIGEYCKNPPEFICCGEPMRRKLGVVPGLAVNNPLAGDRMYTGLRTLDGVDVSTRTKHRAYMKERGLTTADDYRDEWKRAAQERERIREGTDPTRRADVERAFAQVHKP